MKVTFNKKELYIQLVEKYLFWYTDYILHFFVIFCIKIIPSVHEYSEEPVYLAI